MDRLYEIAESQGGYLTARQAIAAGIPRSTLAYHAGHGNALERIGSGVYRLRRFPSPAHGHVIAAWLALAHADAVVSHESTLELHDLSDIIADEVHVTLPRGKRGVRIPSGARAHFTTRPIDGHNVLGVRATSVERTVADVLRNRGWTEQIELAVREAVQRGLTTQRRLISQLPAKWHKRVASALEEPGVT